MPGEVVVVAVEADDVLLPDLQVDPAAVAEPTGREGQRLLGVHVTLVEGLVTPRNSGDGGRAKQKHAFCYYYMLCAAPPGRRGTDGSSRFRVFYHHCPHFFRGERGIV